MTTQQWVNTDDDGAVYALLRKLADNVDVAAIDILWLFPTRRASGVESTVCVISAFDLADAERRRVGAVRWLVTRDRRGRATVDEDVHEYATAPVDAVPRVVDGVMRRLGGDALEPPRSVEVGGDATRWAELLRDLGAPEPVDQPEPDEPADGSAEATAAGEIEAEAASGTGSGVPSSPESTDQPAPAGQQIGNPLHVADLV